MIKFSSLLVFCYLLASSLGYSSNLYWVSSGASNWANASNWSFTSGTGGGDGIPGSGDVAIFDGVASKVGDCNIDAVVNVSGITTLAAYTGTISQNSNAITVGVSGGSFAGGIFSGGNASITMNGNFTISGCTFTSTSATFFDISGASITLSSGSFAHNNGAVSFSSSSNTINGNFTFYNLTLTNTSGIANTMNIGAGNSLVVLNTLSISGSSPINVNTGTIEARGDVTQTNSSTSGGGTAILLINGTGNQTLTGQGTSGKGLLLPLTINKSAGILFLSSIITTSSNWVYSAGSINYGTSRVVFTGTPNISGSFPPFYDVEFLGPATITIAAGNTPVVNGAMFITGTSAVTMNTGNLNVLNDLTITNSAYGGGGTGTISLRGTGVQNLTGSGVSGQGALPVLNIICTCTLNLIGTITSSNNWLYTSGTLNPGTSRNVFTGNLGLFGNHTLNEIELSGSTTSSIYVQPGNTVTASGNLLFTGTNPVVFTAGTIAAQADILITNTGVNGSGAGTILINGTGTQNMTSSITTAQSKIPYVVINKPSGTLNMSGTINVSGDWTFVQGNVVAGTSNVIFYYNRNVNGQGTSVTMDFYNVTLGDFNRRTMLGNLSITNTLKLDNGNLDLNGYTCFITRSSPTAVTTNAVFGSTAGYIKSENTSNLSKLSWNIGATLGTYVYPFGTAAPVYIPLSFQLTAGDAGYVTISTYPTSSNNTPLPVTPDPVSAVNTKIDNSGTSVIDRFWQIDKAGATATATLTYSYAAAEVSGSVVGNESSLRAQRYSTAVNNWDNAIPGQTVNVATRKVTEPGVSLFSPRTLALSSNPLPVNLISFEASCSHHNLTTIKWVTGSETNNDYYTIERADSNLVFNDIAQIKGAGTVENTRTYFYEDRTALKGLYYYKLKQTDYNGAIHNFNTITTPCLLSDPDVVIYPNPGNGYFIIQGVMPGWRIGLTNVLGAEIYSIKAGNLQSELDLTQFAKGVYFVHVNNGYRIISRKIVIGAF